MVPTGHRVDIKRDWRQLTKAAGITGLRDSRSAAFVRAAELGQRRREPAFDRRAARALESGDDASVRAIFSTIRSGRPSRGSAPLSPPPGREKEAVQAPVQLKPHGRRR